MNFFSTNTSHSSLGKTAENRQKQIDEEKKRVYELTKKQRTTSKSPKSISPDDLKTIGNTTNCKFNLETVADEIVLFYNGKNKATHFNDLKNMFNVEDIDVALKCLFGNDSNEEFGDWYDYQSLSTYNPDKNKMKTLIGKLKNKDLIELITEKIKPPTGGKRRTKRRRQTSNKKRTNKRKKTKTIMKKRKTHKRKTNKRRRKR
mgnify:CR=1 FL=1|jgi:hypothetical protein